MSDRGFFPVYIAEYNMYDSSTSYKKHKNQELNDHSDQSNDNYFIFKKIKRDACNLYQR